MFSAEVQRIILFGALGLVLVMIWQSWVEFKQEHAATAQITTPPGALTATPAADLPADLPTTPATPDIPAAPTADTAEDSPPATAQKRLIRVTTDVVRAHIDPHGGDLVRLELLRHPVDIDHPQDPFVLLHQDSVDLSIAQSGLLGNGREYPNHGVRYTTSRYEYDLGGGDSVEVALHWEAPDGVAYQKVYRFHRASYGMDIEFHINNRSAEPWVGFAYGQLKQTEIRPQSSMGFLGRLPSYHGAAIYTTDDKYDKIDYDDMREETLRHNTPSGWVSMLQHYFVVAWLPPAGDQTQYQFYSGVSESGAAPQYRIGYKSTAPLRIAAGAQGVANARLFAGPKEQAQLHREQVDGLLLTVDYGWFTPIADPLFWLLNKIHGVVGNWGWAIILLTLLVKAVFYPLSATSYKSMAKMKRLQPRMQTLKERHGDDKQKFQQEMMSLYKSEKVNPAGGCLPILVQIPVFIALYWTLLESVELRQAEFMLWIKDLAVPDPYFVLPVIMGASMLAQHFLNPSPVDPLQKKIMLAMPIVFTVFFLWFPAGLVLYWVVNNLLSIAQQYYITRKFQTP